MAFDAARLSALLDAMPLPPGPSTISPTPSEMRAARLALPAIEGEWKEGVGVNSQRQLAEAERLFQERRRAAMAAG